MTIVWLLTVTLLALALVAGLGACGGGAREAVVVQVGDSPITNATVAHWMAVMAPQHIVPDPPRYAACIAHDRAVGARSDEADLQEGCAREYQALRRQVLGFLISSQWLVAQAADEGVGITAQEVKRRLVEKKESFPHGRAEFEESLKAIGRSVEDVEREVRAELASTKIRGRLIKDKAEVTPADVAAYYRRNVGKWRVPERRNFDIAENFRSDAEARKVMSDVKARRSRLADKSIAESLPRKSFADYSGEKRIIYEAIFKATPHVLTGPIRLNSLYFVIEVTHVTPAYVQSLAQVRSAIVKKLSTTRQRRALARFVAAWRSKWTAKTDCHAGYVVQKCRQYTGPTVPEDPLALN
jgi:parvulin-like peptidyl-prolyl isomerase